jgi:hypothetical protein
MPEDFLHTHDYLTLCDEILKVYIAKQNSVGEVSAFGVQPLGILVEDLVGDAFCFRLWKPLLDPAGQNLAQSSAD